MSSLLDGALNEGASAEVARTRAARATDPDVRALQERIAEDEARHAELAWDVIAFCIARGDAPVRVALARALARLERTRPEPRGVGPGLEAHGVASDEDVSRIWRATAARVRLRASAVVRAAPRPSRAA